jgi:hypothetical protein
VFGLKSFEIMIMDKPAYTIDKAAFSVVSLHDPPDDKAFWLAKTPHERLEALEYMRQVAYGYDPFTERLQRVLSVVERPTS